MSIISDFDHKPDSVIASQQQENQLIQSEKISLSGMHCAACVQLIEFRVRQLPGINLFKINTATHKAEVVWQSEKNNIKNIISAIIHLGYGALPATQSPGEFEKKESKLALWRLFIAGFAMMQIMMYAFPAYLVPVPQVDGDLTPDLDKLLKIASMLIAVPVVGFSALPFFKAAWRDLRNRHIGMDVPVSLGILLTFFASVWATFRGGVVYYDSAIMFVFLLLSARLIESKVQQKTTTALRVLTQLVPVSAQKLISYPQSREVLTLDASALHIDDLVLVAPGDHIPADGIVLEGHSECDEALMTGESRPVLKTVGDNVIAGAINTNGTLIIKALKVGMETHLSSLIEMMETAATEKPPIVLLADKHASRFLSIILLIALLTGIFWTFFEPDRALWIAISVIVVTCPCALSLATPGVMSAAIGLLAKNGVLIKNGKAIQTMAEATHFVFDKTGTLTVGKLRVAQQLLQRDVPQAESIAFLLASGSGHPAARAIADALAAQNENTSEMQVTNMHEVAGGGIEALIDNRSYRLGSIDFALGLASTSGLKDPQFFEIPTAMREATVSVLADEDGVMMVFALADTLRVDAIETVKKLQARHKKILLLSGDRDEVVQAVARDCGIDDARANLSPADKFNIVQSLQAEGAIVVMVGDGMNDGPALSLANVAVAMGQGAPISQTRSDVLLMSNRLSDLDFGFVVANKAFRLIRENLIWAIAYNLFAIPAAVIGWLEPWHAALGMSLSSLIVVLNALRLYLLPQPEYAVTEVLI
ncbi:cation-translocating P-type ATPase [Undibacterium jejuense]|uniref:Cation-translocating P-type ATPase n=1 Tax=Undibacterium jejuense TaxID=1344949 RepID=A0A923HDB1_9BURK|nr:cation-translocating P-type ATPase [Undibacterium jejuense]MBC3861639.1 cation-translocating P-type ATPase [Undibacterium jejuense]